MWSVLDFQEKIRNISDKAKIELPPDNMHYHISSNVLLVSKKEISLDLPFIIESKEINGFLNFRLDKNLLKGLKHQSMYKKVNIEFSSPNPTGPMHLAHCRGTIIGNTLVNLCRFAGQEVLSEMYINDQGVQMEKFIESVKYWKIGAPFQLHYKGAYVKELAEQLEIVNSESVIIAQLSSIMNTLKNMSINHDLVVRESSLHKIIEEVKNHLQKMGLLYEGYLPNQKQDGKHLLLKTSVLGYENDSVFQRENGKYTYFAFDIAYHFYKKQRGYLNQICVLGEDHFSHMNKLPRVLKIFDIDLKIVTFSAVHLIEQGEKLAMSKRDGTFITIDDFLTRHSIDEITCMVLEQKLEKVLQFDDKKTSNNVFYFQYAFERTRNLPSVEQDVDLNLLSTLIEERLFTFLIHFERFVHLAVEQLNVHKLFDFCLKFVHCLCDYFRKDPRVNINPSKEQIYLLQKCSHMLENINFIFNFHFVI
jgi:arginyl-tRNA synthetase